MFHVITVTLNAEAHIEKNILSVKSQKKVNVQHYIFDGGSQDSTTKIVRKYADVELFKSFDNGIYDAMNKAFSAIKSRIKVGDIIHFLNADDFYKHSEVLYKVENKLTYSEAEAVFSRVDYFDLKKESIVRISINRLPVNEKIDYFLGFQAAHPGIFLQHQGIGFPEFEVQYDIAADYQFQLEILERGSKVVYLDEILVTQTTGGYSQESKAQFVRGKVQIFRIVRKRYGNILAFIAVLLNLLRKRISSTWKFKWKN